MEHLLIKLAFIIVIATTGLIGGFLPARMVHVSGGAALALGNAFAGGIFLGAGLLHLLPDSGSNFTQALGATDYPFAVLGCGLGILLILTFDQIASRRARAEEGDHPHAGRAMVLFLILSIHSVIAGAALGIETEILSAIAIFIAIIAHKGAAAFALGISLTREDAPPRRRFWTIVPFALMTPVGIILGTVLTQVLAGPDHIIWEACFDALAAGTFLYVATGEILPESFSDGTARWSKLGAVGGGFGLMAAIAVWT